MTETEIHTIPLIETPYDGQYPDMLEYDFSVGGSLYVNQGFARISDDGIPLHSEGFSKCIALLLVNQDTDESAMFHIDDIDLTHRQTPFVQDLMLNFLDQKEVGDEELRSALDHIINYRHPANYGGMGREEFQARMENINSDGIMKARFVAGTHSRRIESRIRGSLFGFLGIGIEDTITADTNNYHWALTYRPSERTIYVNSKFQKKVLSFSF